MALALGVFAAVATSGVATSGGGVRSSISEVRSNAASHISVGRSQKEVLRRLLLDLSPSQIAHATLGAPPRSFKQPKGSAWLFLKVRVATPVHYTRGYWQGHIIAGLLRDVSTDKSFSPVQGISFTKVFPRGREERAEAGIIALERQPFVGTTPAELRRTIEDAVRTATPPASLVSLTIDRPLGRFAVRLAVRTSNASVFLSDTARNFAHLQGDLLGGGDLPSRVDGMYVEVNDRQRRLVAASGYSVRTGGGIARIGAAYQPGG